MEKVVGVGRGAGSGGGSGSGSGVRLRLTGRVCWQDYLGKNAPLGQGAPPLFTPWTTALAALRHGDLFRVALQVLRYDFGGASPTATASATAGGGGRRRRRGNEDYDYYDYDYYYHGHDEDNWYGSNSGPRSRWSSDLSDSG